MSWMKHSICGILEKNRYDYGKYFEKWYAQDLTDMIKKISIILLLFYIL